VQGGLATRAVTVTPFANNVNLPANASFVIVGPGTGVVTAFPSSTYIDGQRMTIFNSGGYNLIVQILAPGNVTIPPNEARDFICRAPGGWVLTTAVAQTNAWRLTGNAGTDTSVNFIGTTDNMPLLFKVNNAQAGLINPNSLGDVSLGFESLAKHKNAFGGNVSLGTRAMYNDTSGSYNVAIGNSALFHNTNKEDNVAIGSGAMYNNGLGLSNTDPTKGSANTAIGAAALQNNRRGSGAVAIGSYSAFSDTAANGIIAIGRAALYNNNKAENNLAIGDSALFNNTLGALFSSNSIENLAIGNKSLFSNTTGRSNLGIGYMTLTKNTSGTRNIAIGYQTLSNNISGITNTVVGHQAGLAITTGNSNSIVGDQALGTNNGNDNVAIGRFALYYNTIGSKNTALGSGALDGIGVDMTGSGNVAIGYQAGFNEATSNKLFIENSSAKKDSSLIYGDFAADSLMLNAKTIIRNQLTVKQSGDLTGIELGYLTSKQTDAGKIQYGGFGGGANVLNIVGGGTVAGAGGDRAIKLWSEGGLRIRGTALPDDNNFYDLGSTALRWRTLYSQNVVNTSDARLKTNITTSPYGLQQVLLMKPVQYNWKTNPNTDLQIGFLAQDIKEIIPEAVVTPTNGDPMGMKYNELIPVLVKAIQEQQKQIEELKKENAAIKNKLGMEK
jgi:trimeric autotransporter adhesin